MKKIIPILIFLCLSAKIEPDQPLLQPRHITIKYEEYQKLRLYTQAYLELKHIEEHRNMDIMMKNPIYISDYIYKIPIKIKWVGLGGITIKEIEIQVNFDIRDCGSGI